MLDDFTCLIYRMLSSIADCKSYWHNGVAMQKTIGYIVEELHAICEQARPACLSHLGELCHPLCSVNSSACLRLCNSNCPNVCTVLAFMCIVFVYYILCIHVTEPVGRSAGYIMFSMHRPC